MTGAGFCGRDNKPQHDFEVVMTGISLRYQANLHEPDAALRRLAQADRAALADEIGNQVLTWTMWNFDQQQTPEGVRWEPSARAKAEGGKTLQDKGHLRDSYTYLVDPSGDWIEVGSAMVYAAIHHFGGKTKPSVIRPKKAKALAFGGGFYAKVNHPGSEIPARPALGLTEGHMRDIGDIVLDFYRGVLL